MKREEKLAHQYLVSLGLGPAVYEPERNAPPDFLLNGTIAVEVRRLNQNEITETGERRGLEETWIPFNMQFRKLLASFGPPRTGISWFVSYSISRPLDPWSDVRPALKRCLTIFRDNPSTGKVTMAVTKRLEIDFFPASKVHPTLFLWGAGQDYDSGGFVVHEMLKNLQMCVEEKTRVVANHRHKYPEWWLVFIDLNGWVLDEYDRSQLREHWNMEHDWDKIILISPQNPLSAFEIE
jgi:hypothetical protein